MARSRIRIRVLPQGSLEIVDPGFDTLGLLRDVDPSFRIARSRLPGLGKVPGFVQARETGSGLSHSELEALSTDALWDRHAALLRAGFHKAGRPAGNEASLLHLKAKLARRLLHGCGLCARRCAVDRSRGQTGVCGLGADAFVAEHFVHIAEEAPINPSLVFSMRGCGLRCRYCQQHEILSPRGSDREKLEEGLWDEVDARGARTMSFVGGNPDESLPAILSFLETAPEDWRLPLVWNNHAYMTPEVCKLLRGVVDAYVPDLKHFSDQCSERLSRVNRYPTVAAEAIEALIGSGQLVIVRILVLPGHFDCCHSPALEFLGRHALAPNLRVSIRGQYAPDWKIGPEDGQLARRVLATEVEEARAMARKFGLRCA